MLKPVKDSDKGLAISSDVNPNYTSRDPYWGAASAVDETVRNLAAVGARISSILDNLNFGNPEKPERMWELAESARGLGDMARALDIPFASGNISLYNEGPTGPVPPTPTVMGVGILSHYKHATTMDLKVAGDKLVLVGRTDRDLGGSLYVEHLLAKGAVKRDGERVPQTDAKQLQKLADFVVAAIEAGLVRAAHDCSEGGLAVALAEMAFAGNLGVAADVAGIGAQAVTGPLRGDHKLFAESNSRWVLEVVRKRAADFDALAAKHGVSKDCFALGEVVQAPRVVVMDGKAKLIDVAAEECREAWRTALPKLMGVAA